MVHIEGECVEPCRDKMRWFQLNLNNHKQLIVAVIDLVVVFEIENFVGLVLGFVLVETSRNEMIR
jgi:hypothetical protein